MENIRHVKSLLKDIQQRKFLKKEIKYKIKENGNKKSYKETSHDIQKIKSDFRFNFTKEWLYKKYVIEEYGRPHLVKKYNLEISPNVLKRAFEIFEIPSRKLGEVTNRTKKIRSKKAKKEYKNKIGWWDEKVVRQCKKYNGRGIQGYYFNKSKQKYVWLRSSFEYIYAKWLDYNKFSWDVERERFKVKEKTYKPDFFIYDKQKLVKIIEIKGYWNISTWKAEELNKLLDIEVIIINKEEIKNYTNNINKDTREWKQIRLKKLE